MRQVPLLGAVLLILVAHVAAFTPSEPFFNNDETRHVMTGVYVRDLLLDHPAPADLRDYTIGYYLQYPALGLLVWPPAFYGIEGVVFLALGDAFLTARLLVGVFGLMACVYCYLLVRRTHGQETALGTTLLFGLSPLVFQYSDRVMLEVPTLAWCLMAAFHFHRFLEHERKRDLALCCLATALAALTRFDGVLLAPFFLIWLLAAGKLRLLRKRAVLIGIGLAIAAVAPFYYLTMREFGAAHVQAVQTGTSADSTGFLHPRNFLFYPMSIPGQIGWAALLPALVGFACAWRADRRAAAWPYLALLIAVYLTFTPLAEVEERHAIYWVPALALFAVEGCRRIVEASGIFPKEASGGRQPPVATLNRGLTPPARLLTMAILVGVGVQTGMEPRHYVRGYEDAARFVVEHSEEPVCLFDGFLNGGFIYQVRRHDPERRLWVLRGDKLFYGMLSDPHAGYEEHVKTTKDVLDLIWQYDPEFIVVENPQVHFDLPAARLLRETLEQNPQRFKLLQQIPIDSNHPFFARHELCVYRNTIRNPSRTSVIQMKVLGLRRSLEAPMKHR